MPFKLLVIWTPFNQSLLYISDQGMPVRKYSCLICANETGAFIDILKCVKILNTSVKAETFYQLKHSKILVFCFSSNFFFSHSFLHTQKHNLQINS